MDSDLAIFDRLTERLRQALFAARHEASQRDQRSIQPEHVLLPLLRDADDRMLARFAALGVSGDALALWAAAAPGERAEAADEVPFGARTKEMLHLAREEADRLGHTRIDTGHVLLAQLRDPRSVLLDVLSASGGNAVTARDAVVRFFLT